MLRNRSSWRTRLARLQGSPIDLDLSAYDGPLAAINTLEPELAALEDDEIDGRARAVVARARAAASSAGAAAAEAGGDRWSVHAGVYALVRELARREIGLRPFDEQIVAALALDSGAVVEMQTGEGKTLAAVMPAALNALSGLGVHVLTFNDYLARRDAEWMGPIYRRLGLSAGVVQQGMTGGERRRAYACDVTYVTAKEAGFDHLRDLLAYEPDDLVHRRFHLAIVDEADSILIDEARVPLVIAGSVGREAPSAGRLAALIARLQAGVHFDADEYGRDVELTDAGIDEIERSLGCGSLHEARNLAILTEVNCALHARVLLRRDVDYLVRDGRIAVIDELTGRVVPDRHWPDGLQAALEAKEGIERRPDGRILGSITLQHFLRGYPRLCGMTGTAQPAASELIEFYGLRTVVIPTHRPMIRLDRPDVVYARREDKELGLVHEIARAHETGRPVLVGTLTVEESERLAGRLADAKVPCEVLNARHDAAEARVIAGAGAPGAVTISTNMAGRGTDIRLGGPDESQRDAVVALGGLYVIGTNRHESRRIDLQLRGRAGRQGDPGESRFFVSLEDDLLVQYGIRTLVADHLRQRDAAARGADASMPAADEAGRSGANVIDHPLVLREVARVQRIVEGQNFEIRKTLCRYTDVVERQRRELMDWRQKILHGLEAPGIWQHAARTHDVLVPAIGQDAVQRAERIVTLHGIDRAWRDHLAGVADVREGIHLVSLGGRDPLTHFTRQVTAAFADVGDQIEESVLDAVEHVQVTGGRADLAQLDLKGPSSTWTYLVNDDPFRDRIGRMLTGPGRATFAIGGALFAMPLMIAWGLIDSLWRRRPGRRDNPFGR